MGRADGSTARHSLGKVAKGSNTGVEATRFSVIAHAYMSLLMLCWLPSQARTSGAAYARVHALVRMPSEGVKACPISKLWKDWEAPKSVKRGHPSVTPSEFGIFFHSTLPGFKSPWMNPARFKTAKVVASAHATRCSASPARRFSLRVSSAISIKIAAMDLTLMPPTDATLPT
eukprot:3923502-Amphidinium_carterae.1